MSVSRELFVSKIQYQSWRFRVVSSDPVDYFRDFHFFRWLFGPWKLSNPGPPQQWIFYYVVITIIIMITKMGSKIEKVCFSQELLIKCFTKVFRLENSVSKLTFSCRLLRSCRLFSRFSFFPLTFWTLKTFQPWSPKSIDITLYYLVWILKMIEIIKKLTTVSRFVSPSQQI